MDCRSDAVLGDAPRLCSLCSIIGEWFVLLAMIQIIVLALLLSGVRDAASGSVL